MMLGATRGPGGATLAAYLETAGVDQSVRLGPSRGLLARTLPDQIAELGARAARGRSWKPLSHVWASPDPSGPPWTEEDWSQLWARYEAEFELQEQPCTEVVHTKSGRENRHRVYLLTRGDGICIRTAHGHARREYVARRTEFERGETLVAGGHNKAVHQRCIDDGRHALADAIKAAGLLDCARPRAITSRQRRQAERTGVAVRAVERLIWDAWSVSPTWAEFLATLKRVGYHVFAGQRAVVVRDPRGGVHGLRATLDIAARAHGLPGLLLKELRAVMADAMVPPPLPKRERRRRQVSDVGLGLHAAIDGISAGEGVRDEIGPLGTRERDERHEPDAAEANTNARPSSVPPPDRTARDAPESDPVASTVTYTATMPDYDVARHRGDREAWLETLRHGTYDADWLRRSVDVEVIDVVPSPGPGMATIHLSDGARIVDRFRTLRYTGPMTTLTPEHWRQILVDRDWITDTPERNRNSTEDDSYGQTRPAPGSSFFERIA